MRGSAPDPPRRRGLPVAAIIITTLVVLAGCGDNPTPTGPGGPPDRATTGSPSAIAYAVCMRAHAVPNFPDPDSRGNPPQADPQQLGISPSRYQAAEQACQSLLPTGGSLQQQTQQCVLFGDCPGALVQQVLTVERQYAQCLRAHGVSNWPDPTVGAKGRPVFDLSHAGIDPDSTNTSQFRSNDRDCRRLIGGSVPTLPST